MKSMQTLSLTLGMLLAASTFVLAGGKTGATSTGQSSTSGTSQYKTQQSGQSAIGQGIAATVQEVDQQDRKVTLRTQEGESVELQVPQQMLTTLQEGDSVEISIRKSQYGQSGMNTQSGQSGSTSRPKSQ
jgi:Cu/Ag efflux protein CusF